MEQLTKNQAVATSQEAVQNRSEERRVGKECRSRRAPQREKKKDPAVGAGGAGLLVDGAAAVERAQRRTHLVGAGLRASACPTDRRSLRSTLHLEEATLRLQRRNSWAFFFQAEDGIRDRSRHSC